ncbi:hypothetical protein ABW45_11635 [Stenotrophomonas maltophilia]|nr:hypothetical protein ABW45_11635 [Stenotrophomonas maltophilia]
MPRGFRQRDPTTGQVLVDVTTRLPRIMGRVQLSAGTNGSVAVPPSGSNPLFYWFNASTSEPAYNASPLISESGGTITWTYNSTNPAFNRSGVLVYGRY